MGVRTFGCLCWFACVGVVGALLPACGSEGDGDGGGGTAPTTTAEEFCQGKLAREESCLGTASESLAECLENWDTLCIFAVVRPEILATLADCLNMRPCNQNDDMCFYQTGMDAPAAGQLEYMQACTTKHDACGSAFSSDHCGTTTLTTETYAERMTCLDLECADVNGCLRGTLPQVCG